MGQTTVEKAKGYTRIRWMDDTPLPFDNDDGMMLIFKYKLFSGPCDEISNDTIQRKSGACNHDASLAGCDEV